MKKILFSVVVAIGISACANAQKGCGEHYNYLPMYGVNGFMTVSEQNSMMEKEMAERRRREKEEDQAQEQRIKKAEGAERQSVATVTGPAGKTKK